MIAPRILAETADDLVVVKPAGVASELTTDPDGRSLLAGLQRTWPEARLVHRLDRPTRGLLVVALSREVAAFHGAQLAARAWTKLYLARVPGPADPLIGLHRAYLKERNRRSEVVRSGGRPSALEVLATAPAPGRPDESHVLIRLLTGRRHQIRVTLAHLGAPLVGDSLYGGPRGDLYLEAAALCFPGSPDGARRAFFDPDDPDREPVDPALIAALQATLGA